MRQTKSQVEKERNLLLLSQRSLLNEVKRLKKSNKSLRAKVKQMKANLVGMYDGKMGYNN